MKKIDQFAVDKFLELAKVGFFRFDVFFRFLNSLKTRKVQRMFFLIFTIFVSENCNFKLFFELVGLNRQFYQGMCS